MKKFDKNTAYDVVYTQGFAAGVEALKNKILGYMPYATYGNNKGEPIFSKSIKEGMLSEKTLLRIVEEVLKEGFYDL